MEKAAKSGFTLIELITVAVIVTLLAGLVTTAFMVSFQSRSTENFTKELTAYLRFIQSKSIAEGKVHKLIAVQPGGTLSVLVQNGTDSEFQPFHNLFSKRFEDEEKFSVSFGQGNEILFSPDGMISRNKLIVSDERGERATVEIKNRIGAFKVIFHE